MLAQTAAFAFGIRMLKKLLKQKVQSLFSKNAAWPEQAEAEQ